MAIAHQQLAWGDRCPDCGRGKVYVQKEPKALIRIVGQAPLAATIYELQRLRCNACGQVFTAQEPEGVGHVSASPLTGNLLILWNGRATVKTIAAQIGRVLCHRGESHYGVDYRNLIGRDVKTALAFCSLFA